MTTKSQPRLHGIGRDGNVAAEANDCNPNGVMSRRGLLVRGGASWVAKVGKVGSLSVEGKTQVNGGTPPQETLGNVAHVHFRQHDEKLMKGGLKVYHDHFSCIFVYGLRMYLRRHGTKNMSFSGSLNISQATKLKVFGSLPFPAPEPFTVRVTSPMCEVFFITSALINAMVM